MSSTPKFETPAEKFFGQYPEGYEQYLSDCQVC
jgi:hypothetical protein